MAAQVLQYLKCTIRQVPVHYLHYFFPKLKKKKKLFRMENPKAKTLSDYLIPYVIQEKNSRICVLFESTYTVMPWFSNCGPQNSIYIHKRVSRVSWRWGRGIREYGHQDPHTCTREAQIWPVVHIHFCERFYFKKKSVLKVKIHLKTSVPWSGYKL